jgi:hypothetical protein
MTTLNQRALEAATHAGLDKMSQQLGRPVPIATDTAIAPFGAAIQAYIQSVGKQEYTECPICGLIEKEIKKSFKTSAEEICELRRLLGVYSHKLRDLEDVMKENLEKYNG